MCYFLIHDVTEIIAAIGTDICEHSYLVGADLFSISSTETNAAETRPYTAKVNNNDWLDHLRSFFSLLNYGYTILANSGVGKQFWLFRRLPGQLCAAGVTTEFL